MIDRPITYLYNTLHYYELKLRDKPALKKKLVGSIIGSLKDIKPPNWALSDQYNAYLGTSPPDEVNWAPEPEYYAGLIARFVDGNVCYPSMMSLLIFLFFPK